MNRRGFTVVEIIITVTVMGILLLLAVVNLSATQVRARDDTRKTSVASIATALEAYYSIRPNTTAEIGRYPATTQVDTPAEIQSSFPDATTSSFIAPGASDITSSFIMATNATQTTTGVTPQPTVSQYVYQPISGTGTLCTSSATNCRKFNLYYRLEGDNTVYRVESRNR